MTQDLSIKIAKLEEAIKNVFVISTSLENTLTNDADSIRQYLSQNRRQMTSVKAQDLLQLVQKIKKCTVIAARISSNSYKQRDNIADLKSALNNITTDMKSFKSITDATNNAKSYIIRTDGTKVVVMPASGKQFELEELQEIVGGYIEVVNLSDDRLLVVNENGKLYNMSLNESATALAHDCNAIFANDFIVGDAAVIDRSMLN